MIRETSLSKNIVQFCRFLRSRHFIVGVEEEATALSMLRFIDLSDRSVFMWGLKIVLCKSQKELNEFDNLFNGYWKELERALNSKVKDKKDAIPKATSTAASFKALASWLNGNHNREMEQVASYSFNETLSQKDFSTIPADELDEVLQIIRALSKRLAAQLKRRYEKANSSNLPDLGKTLRKNMSHGGELLEIAFRKPKNNRTQVVILCDISKSMDLYVKFLLQFMYAFQQVYKRIGCFAFGTSLQYITPVVRQNDFLTSLQAINAAEYNWSGGTRIGESLQEFVTTYGGSFLDKRTIVIIVSDGWDTGATELVAKHMKVIHTRSKKVIWLNPLAGYLHYRPDVAAMQAALPYVDVLASVHNADSLRKLGKWL